MTQDDLRVARTGQAGVANSVWNGSSVSLFSAKNEVVSFAVILEAASKSVGNVSVTFNRLTGPGGAVIQSQAASGDGVFNYTNRNIENFYVRYLPINGLSLGFYGHYDERHIPAKLRRPYTGEGYGSGTWANRPDHDKLYPDIAVPLEAVNTFMVAQGKSQTIWSDIYVPKTATAGAYTGTVTVSENGVATRSIPVTLTVHNVTLPDSPTAKTMLYIDSGDINKRYIGNSWPSTTTDDNKANLLRDRHFQLAHRHKISLIDDDAGMNSWTADAPRPDWVPRLNGQLFTSAQGYDGPGVGVGNGIYSIGTYGNWSWKNGTESDMDQHSNGWVNWFNANSPGTEYFLYLIDESGNYPQMNQWASWIHNNPGVGKALKSFATVPFPTSATQAPALDIATSWFTTGITSTWQNALSGFYSQAGKQAWLYNSNRPAAGTFATEDEGVALRELVWAQYKKGIKRWYYWDATYYNNYQGGLGQTDVFSNAHTFGGAATADATLGQTGWNYENGDGVLMYPGTDTVFPAQSYGLTGPIASLRLKHWRRGIQDVDYIAMANAVDPVRTQAIVASMVPKAFWEYGVTDPSDPTWVRADISWSTDPDDWEAARAALINIIEGH